MKTKYRKEKELPGNYGKLIVEFLRGARRPLIDFS